jgi:flagellar biogenesis protein FliO
VTNVSDLVLAARVGGSLAVVLLAATLVARLARRAGHRSGRGALAVRERVGLTRDTSAVLLEAGDRLLLLGVGPHQVCLLAEFGPGGTVAPGPVVAQPVAVAQPVSAASLVPAPRGSVRVLGEMPAAQPLTRRQIRTAATGRRRPALPPTRRGTGSLLDPRTWQQGVEALRDLTARRG